MNIKKKWFFSKIYIFKKYIYINSLGKGLEDCFWALRDIEVIIGEKCELLGESFVDPNTGNGCLCNPGYFKASKSGCSNPINPFNGTFCSFCQACPPLCKTCSSESLCIDCVGGYPKNETIIYIYNI